MRRTGWTCSEENRLNRVKDGLDTEENILDSEENRLDSEGNRLDSEEHRLDMEEDRLCEKGMLCLVTPQTCQTH